LLPFASRCAPRNCTPDWRASDWLKFGGNAAAYKRRMLLSCLPYSLYLGLKIGSFPDAGIIALIVSPCAFILKGTTRFAVMMKVLHNSIRAPLFQKQHQL